MARIFGLPEPEDEPVDADLPDHVRAVWTAKWLEFILRAKLPTKRMAVAVALAVFADADGSNVRPALQTVADMANLHETAARDHIKALLALGLLVVKTAGGGRGNPTTYRLTRPVDITTLNLWLDQKMHRVPDGAAFIPAARAETPAHTLGNTLSSNTDSLAPTVGNADETLAPTLPIPAERVEPALGNGPVDNPAEAVKGSDPIRKGSQFEAERVVPALPDLTNTYKQNQPWFLQVSTSLGDAITARTPRPPLPTPAETAALVEPADIEPWLPPPAPRIVTGSAVLTPTPEAGDWYRARARRQLRAEGHPDPTGAQLAERAAEIAARADTETRTA